MNDFRFFPDMPLHAAARIAHENGYKLQVSWEGNKCVVKAVDIVGEDFVPAFLRLQVG